MSVINSMTLLEKIKLGVNNCKIINFPGTTEKVKIRVLTDAEELSAEIATEHVFINAKIGVAMHNIDMYEQEKTIQKLFLALTDLEGNPIASSIEAFKKRITRTDSDMLVDEYSALMAECSPSPDKMSTEEFDRLVDAVKKKPESTIGNISSISTLKRLSIYLANQQLILPTASGSTSMQ
jgi:hypothetical protein